ncbi:PHF5-like protein-domain-containing protein [Lentinula raphanica]|nr:PHF5-like protein-domain-containing protein [Lentinula raphanica]
MSKHHPDLIMCWRQPGIAIGRLCKKCDGKCPGCDSYVRPETLVRICDECNFGSYGGRCIICGSPGISDAYIQSRSHSPCMQSIGAACMRSIGAAQNALDTMLRRVTDLAGRHVIAKFSILHASDTVWKEDFFDGVIDSLDPIEPTPDDIWDRYI